MLASAYTIYNASAGSGKTFTLVKSFLKIILENKNLDTFKSLLAITFTNKAVSEMKGRVVKMLLNFSNKEKNISETMFLQIAHELHISEEELTERSQKVLKHILHNYAGLSITTIDAFNHKLIRSFAFDLKLNPNFEVFIDSNDLLMLAVDNLLKKMDTEPQLSKWLIDFSKSQIDDDKSWDITQKLLSVANLLSIENNFEYLQNFENKTFSDFFSLKENLYAQLKTSEKETEKVAREFFNFLQENQLSEKDFFRGFVVNFFKKVIDKQSFEVSFDSKWFQNIETDSLYTKALAKASPHIASLLDANQLLIASWARRVESEFYQRFFLKNALQNLTPLAILNSIRQEIELIKLEENILPISEFNSIISKTLKNEPTPFIYEKLGQRYKHFFIDEFQDTSALQWGNIQPLIADALQSQNASGVSGSLLLVGDAKQSIYRWRGGKAEQFMGLYSDVENPFFVSPQVVDLDKNFRSSAEIIQFNNHFFEFIAQKSGLFKTDLYRNLYENSFQNTHSKTIANGYVSISFVASEEKNEKYCQQLYWAVEDALSCGFSQSDICVITRQNSEAVLLAQFLAEQGFRVVSSEALLLKNVLEINFLIVLLTLLLEPKNQEVKAEMLFLYAQIKKEENVHTIMETYLNVAPEKFFAAHQFSAEHFYKHSFYEGVAYAVACFSLAKPSDAYLSHFLDLIFDFSSSKKGSVTDFLQFWKEKKKDLSISVPKEIDAIKVMTIHKSKGLEFPVVIYAFVNDKLRSGKGKIWLPLHSENYNGFSHLLVDNKKELEFVFPKEITQLVEQEILDQINVLYVALTRPESHLYIISEEVKSTEKAKKMGEIQNYAQLLQAFLKEKNKWDDAVFHYEFGQKILPNKKEEKQLNYLIFKNINSQESRYKIVTKQGLLWDSETQNAIEKGNIAHQLLAKIYTKNDIDAVLQMAFQDGILAENQLDIMKNQLFQVVENEKIKHCFSQEMQIFNEQEFVSEIGEFQRPDRVVFQPKTKEVTIIDYKTGNFHQKYITQMRKYAQTLTQLGWQIRALYLVFINDEIEIVEV